MYHVLNIEHLILFFFYLSFEVYACKRDWNILNFNKNNEATIIYLEIKQNLMKKSSGKSCLIPELSIWFG